MNTNNITQERISAFADGELTDAQLDAVLASLHTAEGRAAWTRYHEIGDGIRSDDLALELSPGFSARMKARLDAEPPIVAPLVRRIAPASSPAVADSSAVARPAYFKRFGLPTMTAAAALAAIGFATAPQLMVASQDSGRATAPAIVAVAADQDVANNLKVLAKAPSKERVLRDPRIDDYLLAHQRFSPSVYSTAQYARSATFATDTDK